MRVQGGGERVNMELLKRWQAENGEQHAVIACHDWSGYSQGGLCSCESCGRKISAFPVVIAKAQSNANFHLICRATCWPALVKLGPIPWGGPIKSNKLPDDLETF